MDAKQLLRQDNLPRICIAATIVQTLWCGVAVPGSWQMWRGHRVCALLDILSSRARPAREYCRVAPHVSALRFAAADRLHNTCSTRRPCVAQAYCTSDPVTHMVRCRVRLCAAGLLLWLAMLTTVQVGEPESRKLRALVSALLALGGFCSTLLDPKCTRWESPSGTVRVRLRH